MKRDWLDLVPAPKRLIERVRRIALSGAVAGLFGGAGFILGPAQHGPVEREVSSSLTATIVDRSRKTAKLVLQLPGKVSSFVAQHRSHSSHSSHRSHASHVSGSGAVAAPAPRPTPPPPAPPRSTLPAEAPAAIASLGTSNIQVAVNARAEQMTAKFFAFDSKQKILTVQDAVGTRFDFTLRDDSTLAKGGTISRLDSYLNSHFNNFPYSANQQIRISWKPSIDGKKRVALTLQ